jgi:hypothetical protein
MNYFRVISKKQDYRKCKRDGTKPADRKNPYSYTTSVRKPLEDITNNVAEEKKCKAATFYSELKECSNSMELIPTAFESKYGELIGTLDVDTIIEKWKPCLEKWKECIQETKDIQKPGTTMSRANFNKEVINTWCRHYKVIDTHGYSFFMRQLLFTQKSAREALMKHLEQAMKGVK